MQTTLRVAALCALAGLCACSPPSISRETRFLMSKPVDCRTAAEEIEILVASRPNTLRRTMTVVQSVDPVGAVGAVVNKDVDNRVRIIKGEHGQDIDERVRHLAKTCNLPIPKSE